MNKRWFFFQEEFKNSVNIIELQENARFTTLATCFENMITELSNFSGKIAGLSELKLNSNMTKISFQDTVLKSLPLNWIEQDIVEMNFDDTVSQLERRKTFHYDDK